MQAFNEPRIAIWAIELLPQFVTHHAKRDLLGIAKSIDPSQPVLSAQSDQGRNFSQLADYLCIKGVRS